MTSWRQFLTTGSKTDTDSDDTGPERNDVYGSVSGSNRELYPELGTTLSHLAQQRKSCLRSGAGHTVLYLNSLELVESADHNCTSLVAVACHQTTLLRNLSRFV